MAHKLRDYQVAAVEQHFSYFKYRSGNPLFVVPTGGGKSLIISEFLTTVLQAWPNQRIIVLTHVMELIRQNYDEFCSHWGLLAPVGIYSAGIGRRDTQESVIFAGIQSVYQKTSDEFRFDLILIDEAHLLPKSGEGRYRTFIKEQRELNPLLKVIGYTATPYRLEGGYLHKGEGAIFSDIAFEVQLKTLIDGKFLAPLVARQPEALIDTSEVGMEAGDFRSDELEDAATEGNIVQRAVSELVLVANKENRKHWLIFTCGVKHSLMVEKELREFHEVNAHVILGDTPKEDREARIAEAKAGKVTALINCGVLTTGFNWRQCDLIGLMRPTKSTALYVQMLGRGMRTYPEGGKTNCLVLDYGGNIMRLGPIDEVVVEDKSSKKKKKDLTPEELLELELLEKRGEENARCCPTCRALISTKENPCKACGHLFSNPIKHDAAANNLDPIGFKPLVLKVEKPYTLPVHSIEYTKHYKRGEGNEDKPPTLRVSYRAGLRTVSEWVCFEHHGIARQNAVRWWMKMGNTPDDMIAPETVDQALDLITCGYVKKPDAIVVRKDPGNEKYDRVIDHVFSVEEKKEADSFDRRWNNPLY